MWDKNGKYGKYFFDDGEKVRIVKGERIDQIRL